MRHEYWKSLDELNGLPVEVEDKINEFMPGVSDPMDLDQMPGVTRRRFLAMAATSAAFAATACTGYRDKGKIIPYLRKPEETTPGIANFYASTCTACANVCGTLVKTREGRPIKIDGNPDHPVNHGKVCARGQASIMAMYDPFRLKGPMARQTLSDTATATTWDAVDGQVKDALKATSSSGKDIVLVTRKVVSPSWHDVITAFEKRYPTTTVVSYEPLGDANRQAGWAMAYGAGSYPVIRWEDADVVVSFESDFLGSDSYKVETMRRFAKGRDVVASGKMSRLYVVEGATSLTGMNADYRMTMRPDAQLALVLALLNELLIKKGLSRFASIPAIREKISAYSLENVATQYGLESAPLKQLVDDLVHGKGKVAVIAGAIHRPEMHAAVSLLGEVVGMPALFDSAGNVDRIPLCGDVEWADVIKKMNAGRVGAVIHIDANPVYDVPATLKYREALDHVGLVVTFSETENETTAASHVIAASHHMLESWGDANAREGVFSLQQPMIESLYPTRQKEGVVLAWATDSDYRDTLYHDHVKRVWLQNLYSIAGKGSVDHFWEQSLHDGVVLAPSLVSRSVPTFDVGCVDQFALTPPTDMVAVVRPNPVMMDGRLANNGWLQELPHPVSKIVWDNYAAISEATAKSLGVESNDMLSIGVDGITVTVPAFVQPGVADHVVALEGGYGRQSSGPIASDVGVKVNDVIGLGAGWVSVSVAKGNGSHELVTAQEHHSLSDMRLKDLHYKRHIIREGTLEEYRKDKMFLKKESEEIHSVKPGPTESPIKWGMAIDLNKCTGCSECVVACNVENNIPIVGKTQVKKGREMHWLRIDRYYSGTADNPKASFQPMLCQHCDNAPCENVCPVAATSHSPEGLNDMAYNRCVGTRYCSNNCPYKVRRFNFFKFRDEFADGYQDQSPLDLMMNPEVTVRSRGVMEKCSFCVQRTMEARQKAIQEGRPVKTSDVQTACQQACPSEAIVFGNLKEEGTAVATLREHELGYHVLEELAVKPNVTYVAKLRNIEEDVL